MEMTTKEFRQFKDKALRYLVQDRHLFLRSSKTAPLRRVVDRDMTRQEILEALHDKSGHRGREGTYRRIADRYYWEELWKHVSRYVKSCRECQMKDKQRQEEQLRPSFTTGLWSRINMDAVHMPTSNGKSYLIVARDDVSGWVEARALAKLSSETVAKFVYEDVICRHGCFMHLSIDGGPENKSWLSVLTTKYKIKRTVISAYNSKGNGMVERGHQPIVNALAKMTNGKWKNWDRHLHAVLWADRTTVRGPTGMAPYRLLYGFDPVLPIELDVPTWQILPWGRVQTTSDLLAVRARQLERRDEDLEEAELHLRRMRETSQEAWDRDRRIRSEAIREEDVVLLHDTKLDKSHSDKLSFHWVGPYRVSEAQPDRNYYRLAELDGTALQHTVAGNRLKKFHVREDLDISEHQNDMEDLDSPWLHEEVEGVDEEDGEGETEQHPTAEARDEGAQRGDIEVRIPLWQGAPLDFIEDGIMEVDESALHETAVEVRIPSGSGGPVDFVEG